MLYILFVVDLEAVCAKLHFSVKTFENFLWKRKALDADAEKTLKGNRRHIYVIKYFCSLILDTMVFQFRK